MLTPGVRTSLSLSDRVADNLEECLLKSRHQLFSQPILLLIICVNLSSVLKARPALLGVDQSSHPHCLLHLFKLVVEDNCAIP